MKSRLNIPNLERHLKVILQGTSKFPNLSHFFSNLPLPQPPFPQKEYDKTGKSAALDYFCTDLTKQAETGKLDPVIGREKEIQRVINILNRKTKNNPVLIGEPGVGKTAIIYMDAGNQYEIFWY